MIRGAAVADAFYPGDRVALKSMIDDLLAKSKTSEALPRHALSFVAPHAGYIYSGAVAAYTYNALALQAKEQKYDTFVIVGPNHTGMGEPLAVSMQDWRTPLGVVKNDTELSKQMLSISHNISADEEAHREEHSIEVQLPLLQSVVKEPRCVFVCMGDQSILASTMLADAIDKAATKLGRKVTVIASSDFNHYEPAGVAEAKDMPAIRMLEKVDARGFTETIRKNNDSACGYGPISVSALFAKARGASKGVLLKYGNSGDATRDYKSVVAYASMAFLE